MIKRRLFLGFTLLCSFIGISAQYKILTIEEMFQLADENSKAINIRSIAIDEAEQAIKVAKNDKLPDIKAHLSLNYIGDGYMTDRDFSNAIHAEMPHFGNSFALKASQVVYAGGKISENIRNKQLHQQIAELELSQQKQDLRFILLGYYLDLFQLRNQVVVYQKNIEQTKLLVKDMQAAYKQGTALKSDITRYELQLQNLELGLTTTENKMNVINHHLSTTIGLDPAIKLLPDTTMLVKYSIDKGTESTWREDIDNTPKMKLAQKAIELNLSEQQMIKAERRPNISLFATNEFSGPILIEVPPMNNNFTYWFAGVEVSYNIDALFKSNKKLKKAKISTMKSEEKRKLIEEEIDNALHEAYIGLDEAYVRLRTQKKSVQLAHENYKIVQQRYLNGLSLITDMLDASNMQLDMELKLANDQIGILYQYFLLKKITGSL